MFKWLFGKKGESSGGAEATPTGSPEVVSLAQTVEVPAARAFEVFVDEFDRWWPREYTWGKDRLKKIAIEPKMGGRAYEEGASGDIEVWGKVLTVDRPNHIVIAWQIRPDRTAEPDESQSSRLDIRFMPETDARTNVLVVHRDFFRHGEGWQKYRGEMAGKKGWPFIMDCYAKAVSG